MPVKYSDLVKKPLDPCEYTPERILELKRCSEDVVYFLQYIKIVHPDRGRILFVPYIFQKEILQTIKDNRFVVALAARQVGKSTTIAAYALWYSIFHPDKNVGIVSNKALSAIDILNRVKIMYEEIPPWLKPGVSEYSKTFICFDNGSKIAVSATSTDAFRGRTLNLLVCDEFAFVRKNIAEEFWAANYPTISSSIDAKVVVISTPNGMWNLFHRLYVEAEHGENTFIPLKYTWRCVPGRDAAWAEEQRKNLGRTKFNQEQMVEFLGSINTVIDPNVLEVLFNRVEEPLVLDMNNRLFIYEKPSKDSMYVIGCDTGKGTGENFSCLQVLRVDAINPVKMKQVAIFIDNHIDVYSFADTINRLGLFYNNAYIMVENNSEGSAVVNRLWWEYENQGLVNSGSKNKDLGIRSTRNSKPKAVLLMKKLIEDGDLELSDRETIKQLSSFIDTGNNRFTGKDTSDDLVAALYWATYLVEMNILQESYSVKKMDDGEDKDDVWGILADIEIVEENFDWLLDKTLS